MAENRHFIYDGPVAGFYNRSKEVRKLARKIYKKKLENDEFLVGDDFKEEADYGIYLENIKVLHNPENKYDKNAIEVYSDDIFIGYIPKTSNKRVLKELDDNKDKTIYYEACYTKEDENDEFFDDYNEPERVDLSIYYDY